MITELENLIVGWLKRGLGTMVREVKSYGGEISGENWANAIKQVPACWVTYGGSKIAAKSTSRGLYDEKAKLVVMVATRTLRSEAAARQNGVDVREVGSNMLVWAVLRLLTAQRFENVLDSKGLSPVAVTTVLKDAVIQSAALSVMAIEFDATFEWKPLEDGRFPLETSDVTNPDHIFTKYKGELSDAWPNFLRMDSLIFDDQLGASIESKLELGGNP